MYTDWLKLDGTARYHNIMDDFDCVESFELFSRYIYSMTYILQVHILLYIYINIYSIYNTVLRH